MKRNGHIDPAQQSFSFAPTITPRGDGSFIVQPGKPIPGRAKVTVLDAAKRSGLSESTIRRLYDSELIDGERPSPRSTFIYLDSLEAHIVATRDREFWERKQKIYLANI